MKSIIVKMGNPILRRKARPVPLRQARTKTFQLFLKKMVRVMRSAQGVGLAANQVGDGRQVFVMECRGNKRYPRGTSFPLQAYLNPRITRYSKAVEKGWEGCLSIPGFRGRVPRSKSVALVATTPGGHKISKVFKGFEARVIQHEMDHLNGRFYIDRMRDKSTWMHLEEFNRRFQAKIRDNKPRRS